MHEKLIDNLEELCEAVERDLEESNEKIRAAGGKLSAGDVEYVDKLTHTLKSIKTTLAMLEYDDEDGYSQRGGMSYARDGRGGMRGGSSYARGRMNARRDSRGRYSREGGYSYAEDFHGMLEEAMMAAPNEQTREKLRRMMNEM